MIGIMISLSVPGKEVDSLTTRVSFETTKVAFAGSGCQARLTARLTACLQRFGDARRVEFSHNTDSARPYPDLIPLS